MSIYGLSPFGLVPYGGPGLITVAGILPFTNNSWIVVFDSTPKTLDVTSPNSATNPSNYTLTALDPTYISDTVPDGILAQGALAPVRFPSSIKAAQDQDDPTQIIVWADSALEPGITYQVDVSPVIRGLNCEEFYGPTSFTFTALYFSLEPTGILVIEQRYRDFAMDPYGEDGLEAFRFDNTNDIDTDPALKSLRKRIKRRVFTQKGGFSWAPNYGVGIKAKARISVSQLQSMANAINEQILLEPDVARSSTTVQTINTAAGTFVEIDVYVTQRDTRTARLVFRDQVRQ